MKKIVLSTVAALALSTAAAYAADMPQAQAPIPYGAPGFNWAGFYAGLHAGYITGDADVTSIASTGGATDRVPGNFYTTDVDGAVFGGQLGYNCQFGSWVFGVEGYVSGSTADGTTLSVFGAADDIYGVEVDWMAGVTAKVGYAMNRWLAYVKGGYAGANVNYSVTDTVGPSIGAGSASQWMSGYQIGGGVDYALTNNLILGVEYRFADYGSETFVVPLGAGGSVTDNLDLQTHTIMVNANYKF
ncbi:MAG: outer membrane protein [Flavobacteriaceae bacterium]